MAKAQIPFARLFLGVFLILGLALDLGLGIGFLFWPAIFGHGLDVLFVAFTLLAPAVVFSLLVTCLMYWLQVRKR